MSCTRRLLCRSTAPASTMIPLREAARLARKTGCLGGATSALRPLTSTATNTNTHSNARQQQQQHLQSSASPTPQASDTVGNSHSSPWAHITNQQRQLFVESHTPTEGRAIAATMGAVNALHMEGVVMRVMCGRMGAHPPGPSGCGSPGRRSTFVAAPSDAASPIVLLWLRVEGAEREIGTDATAPPHTLIAARCRLSAETAEFLFQRGQLRAQKNASNSAAAASPSSPSTPSPSTPTASATTTSEGDGEPKTKADTPAILRYIKAWAAERLLHARVIVSGQLRMEEVYDGDLNRAVTVPVIEIPQDNLLGSVKVL